MSFLKETRFVLGLFPVKAFQYYWVYSIAQIQLMLSDKTLVLYKSDKKKGISAKEADAIADKWMAKKEARKEANKGKKLNFNDYING